MVKTSEPEAENDALLTAATSKPGMHNQGPYRSGVVGPSHRFSHRTLYNNYILSRKNLVIK